MADMQLFWRLRGRRWIGAGALTLLATLPVGCASNRLPSQENTTGISAGIEPLAAASIYPLTEIEDTYFESNRRDEEPTKEIFTIRRYPTTDFGAQWANDENGQRTQYWRKEPNGDIVMTASIEHAQDALALFDPPLVIAPAQLDPGVAYESTSEMRVVRASNPDAERTRGTCRRVMEYVGDEFVESILGDGKYARIEIQFESDLSLATTETNTILWVWPGHGVRLEERSELTKALGLFGEPRFMRLEWAGIPLDSPPSKGE